MRLHADAGSWDQAAAVAKDAAPYMHPRLASTTLGSDPDRPLLHEMSDSRKSIDEAVMGFLAASAGQPETEDGPSK
jgi:hypothetical protein